MCNITFVDEVEVTNTAPASAVIVVGIVFTVVVVSVVVAAAVVICCRRKTQREEPTTKDPEKAELQEQYVLNKVFVITRKLKKLFKT